MVENYCKKQIDLTTSSLLTQKGYLHSCNEHKIFALSEPVFDEPEYNTAGEFVLSFVVETRPNIEPTGYVGLQLEKAQINRDQIYEQLLENFRQQSTIDQQTEEVEDRTMVSVDFDVVVDGNVINSGVGQPFFITEKSSAPFGGNLIGKKVGDEVVEEVVLPKEYEKHGGEKAEVKIKIKSSVKKVSTINEELWNNPTGTQYEDLFKAINQRADEVVQERQVAALEELAVDKLLELHEFDVPQSWVENEEKYLLGQFGVEVAPDEKTAEFVKNMAERNVKRTFMLDAILSNEPSLQITEKDVEDVLEAEAKINNVSVLVVKKELKEKNMMDSVIASIKHKKVLTFILNNAQLVEQEEIVDVPELEEVSLEGFDE